MKHNESPRSNNRVLNVRDFCAHGRFLDILSFEVIIESNPHAIGGVTVQYPNVTDSWECPRLAISLCAPMCVSVVWPWACATGLIMFIFFLCLFHPPTGPYRTTDQSYCHSLYVPHLFLLLAHVFHPKIHS